jgi:hypothetical protein
VDHVRPQSMVDRPWTAAPSSSELRPPAVPVSKGAGQGAGEEEWNAVSSVGGSLGPRRQCGSRALRRRGGTRAEPEVMDDGSGPPVSWVQRGVKAAWLEALPREEGSNRGPVGRGKRPVRKERRSGSWLGQKSGWADSLLGRLG